MTKFSSILNTTIVCSDDGTHNYEIIRSLQGIAGDKAIMLTLYPSFSGNDVFHLDSTATHLVNHMMDINVSRVRIINMFSKVVRGSKLSSRNLVVDEENLAYIEDIMKAKDFSSHIFIVAWGSSMERCRAANETKARIIEMYRKHNPHGKLFQLTCEGDVAEGEAVHPLYLGIRNSHAKWKLEEYVPPEIFGKPSATESVSSQQNKSSIKKKLKAV